jgi:hypothetical protein
MEEGWHCRAENYTFFYKEGNEDYQLRAVFSYTTESYNRLAEQNLLVTGYRI